MTSAATIAATASAYAAASSSWNPSSLTRLRGITVTPPAAAATARARRRSLAGGAVQSSARAKMVACVSIPQPSWA